MMTALITTTDSNGLQLKTLQITNITMKPRRGKFSDKIYDVLFINADLDQFLVKDDENNPVWVDFDKCKLV